MDFTHGSIIPLIGGMTLGMSQAFNREPEYFASWPAFAFNEMATYEAFPNVKKYESPESLPYVDVTHAVPPCAGLCRLSFFNTYNSVVNNESNKWMLISAEVAFKSKPLVHIAENAPALATELGRPIRESLIELATNYNYKLSFYYTSTSFHGLPQNRRRCFFFAWNQDYFKGIPVAGWFREATLSPKEIILNSFGEGGYQQPGKPSDFVTWRYLMAKLGMTHEELYDNHKPIGTVYFIEKHIGLDVALREILNPNFWTSRGLPAELSDPENPTLRTLKRAVYKTSIGKGYMDNTPWFGNLGNLRALVGSKLNLLVHPVEDRFLSSYELYGLMGMPMSYPWRNKNKLNVIAQNVPVCTARDMGKIAIAAIQGKLGLVQCDYLIQNNLQKRTIKKALK